MNNGTQILFRCKSSHEGHMWMKQFGVNWAASALGVGVIVETKQGANYHASHFLCKRCREFGELSQNLDAIQHFLFFMSVPAT